MTPTATAPNPYAGMVSAFQSPLQRLIAASGGKISVVSGYRTTQQQAALHAAKPNLAALPGHSNHERGIAADLRFADDATMAWAHQHAADFGLSFPMLGGPGHKNEPWHVELSNAQGNTNPSSGGYSIAPPGQHGADLHNPGTQIGNLMSILAGGFGDGTDQATQTNTSPDSSSVPSADVASPSVGGGDAKAWLINAESSGRTNAKNPKSSAFGIGQLILSNRKKYGAQLGIDPNTTDADQQHALMDAYVKERYGTYDAAKSFHLANGYY